VTVPEILVELAGMGWSDVPASHAAIVRWIARELEIVEAFPGNLAQRRRAREAIASLAASVEVAPIAAKLLTKLDDLERRHDADNARCS